LFAAVLFDMLSKGAFSLPLLLAGIHDVALGLPAPNPMNLSDCGREALAG
jgi:hypothetical protein